VQVPNPSHTPVLPQVDAACCWQRRWPWPAGIALHCPSRLMRLQATQGPLQGALQQRPSAQFPEAHSVPRVHSAPFIFGPQLPPTHFWLLTQLASLVHVVKQRFVVGLHENGVHTGTGPRSHLRLPSQT
jgi:hypothetical protein